MTETHPEAAAILRDAGWAPHDAWQVYTRDTLVMGFQPDGQGFHVKNWAKVQPGDRSYSEDTPDTAEEAAAWLVERFKVNPLSTEATLEPVAIESEAGEDSAHGADANLQHHAGPASDDEHQASDVLVEPEVALDAPVHEESAEADWGMVEGRVDAAFTDADFEDAPDLGAELLDDEAFAHGELPAPDPLDFAPDEIEEAATPTDRFYGLDDLDRRRKLRIGDVATAAEIRIHAIEAEVAELEGEYAAVQAYVVTNLDKFTGAFTPQDDTSLATYHRFMALDGARGRIAAIDRRRREATSFLLTAERADVEAFDPEANWP